VTSIERKYKVEIAAGLGVAVIGGVAIFYAQRAHRKNKNIEPNLQILNEKRLSLDKLERVNLMAAYLLTTPKPTLKESLPLLEISRQHASNAVNFLVDNGLAVQQHSPQADGGSLTHYTPTEPLVEAATDANQFPLLSASIEYLLENRSPLYKK
jgi:hypothetical protein